MLMPLIDDGSVALTLDVLLSTRLVHLVSGLDEEEHFDIRRDGKPTTISGYTEWVSLSSPVISLGWDWHVDPLRGPPWCVRSAPPRSNIRLLDERNREVEWTRSQLALSGVIDALPWQECTQAAIAARYAPFAELIARARRS